MNVQRIQATENTGLSEIEQALEKKESLKTISSYQRNQTSSIGFEPNSQATTASALPEKVDLRAFDKNKDGVLENYVSSIKNQYPWGTCWTFGTLAAIETNLAYQHDIPVSPDSELDLSERHLAYFTFTPTEADNEDNQAGEGAHFFDEKAANKEMYAGWPGFATALFSSGIGLVLESDVPYRGKEGVISDAHYHIIKEGKAYDSKGNLVDEPDPQPSWYSPYDDWSVEESYRYLNYFTLQNGLLLPELVVENRDEKGKSSYEIDENALEIMKDQLASGHALSLCFRADMAMSSDGLEKAQYLNTENWAHYTYDGASFNHLIAVVGYDDTYPKENFLPGHQPPKDGAFICNNSWGEKEAGFPNHRDWGVDGSGYFYLSYYDTSICSIETFDFDFREEMGSKEYVIGEYDYMPSNTTPDITASTPVVMANVFKAPDDILIHALSTQTASANTTVRLDLYRLNEDYQNPMDGKLAASKTFHFPFAGYHRISLDNPCAFAKGDPLSVVITTQRADGSYEICYDQFDSKMGKELANLLETDKADIYWMESVVNPGESYAGGLNQSGEWSWKDWGLYLQQRKEESLTALNQADIVQAIENEDVEALKEADTFSVDPFAFYSYDNFPIKYYADLAANEMPFKDLGFESGKLHWAVLSGDIPAILSKGLMKGKSQDRFAPDDVLKRVEATMTLFRFSGESDPDKISAYTTPSTFKDVNVNAWYGPAMNWAAQNGIFVGSNGCARPNDPISRQELATILYRYAQKTGAGHWQKDSGSQNSSYLDVPDAGDISAWAKDGMAWAYENGLITGYQPSGYLLPKAETKRSEYAKILMTAIDVFNK